MQWCNIERTQTIKWEWGTRGTMELFTNNLVAPSSVGQSELKVKNRKIFIKMCMLKLFRKVIYFIKYTLQLLKYINFITHKIVFITITCTKTAYHKGQLKWTRRENRSPINLKGETVRNSPLGATSCPFGKVGNMAANFRVVFVTLLILLVVVTVRSAKSKNVMEITEEDWRLMLSGEWMVEL